MMISVVLLAVVTIAFPKEGLRLPFVDRAYLIGATDSGETNLVVQGRDVAVHPGGGWVTMVDVTPGTNVIRIGGTRRTFCVQEKPNVSAAAGVQKGAQVANPVERVYKKLEYAGDSAKPHPTGRKPEEITVVLDAGHGGEDTGAVAPHGLFEKDANLLLAKAVRRILSERGYNVLMTRDDDSFPALYDRPKVAHRANADAFISIHHNAPAFDRDPRTIRYHAVYSWNELGSKLAQAINRRMARALGDTLRSNGVMHANFAVTRNPEIPSCLIETDFITTPEGEADCWNEKRRQLIAAAIADGFVDWCR